MRGEVYFVCLDPTRGSEQQGTRPFVIIQRNDLNRVLNTVIGVPLTTNLKRAQQPTAVFIPGGQGGLPNDSVALCNQLRVIDKTRLQRKLGTLSDEYIGRIEMATRYTLGL